VVTLKDMKQATEDYAKEYPELDMTQTMANIEFLWQKATGMELTPELRQEILGLNDESEAAAVRKLLGRLIAGIKAARETPAGIAAQFAIVGKPIDQVMKYSDAFAVAVHIPEGVAAEVWGRTIADLGYGRHVFMMNAAGRLDDRGSTPVQDLARKYPKHAAALMPEGIAGLEFFGDVAELVRGKQMFGLLVDPTLMKAEEIRQQIEFARILAMIGTDSIPEFIYQQTGAGMGGAGASGMASISVFAEAMKQSFLAESLAASAA